LELRTHRVARRVPIRSGRDLLRLLHVEHELDDADERNETHHPRGGAFDELQKRREPTQIARSLPLRSVAVHLLLARPSIERLTWRSVIASGRTVTWSIGGAGSGEGSADAGAISAARGRARRAPPRVKTNLTGIACAHVAI